MIRNKTNSEARTPAEGAQITTFGALREGDTFRKREKSTAKEWTWLMKTGKDCAAYCDQTRNILSRHFLFGFNREVIQDMPREELEGLPAVISIGKKDGALVDENGFYITHPVTLAEIVKRYNSQPALLDACRAYIKARNDGGVSMADLSTIADKLIREAVEGAERA